MPRARRSRQPSVAGAWEAGNARHKYGHYRYDAADYGMTPGKIRSAYRAYLDHFAGYDYLSPEPS